MEPEPALPEPYSPFAAPSTPAVERESAFPEPYSPFAATSSADRELALPEFESSPSVEAAAWPGGAVDPVPPPPVLVRSHALVVALGVLWAALLVIAVFASPFVVALLLAPVAAVAAASTIRVSAAPPSRARIPVAVPMPVLAALSGALVPLAACAGPYVAAGALAVTAVVAAAVIVPAGAALERVRGVLLVVAPSVAAGALVLARRQSLDMALVLVLAICLYDASAYLVGTGLTGGFVGAFAGMVSVGVLSVLVAAALNPPFTGRSPWEFAGLICVMAPLGVLLVHSLDRGARRPALRRLDSLVLAGPAWVASAAILLHR